MLLLRGLIVCIMQVPNESHGNVLLGKWNETSIECSSKSELTFSFINKTSNRSRTIAECDVMSKTCFMLDKSLQNKYRIYYNGHGGILQITSSEETRGTYTCFETYKPEMFASTTIVSRTSSAGANYRKSAMATVTGKTIECSSNSELTFKYSSIKTNVPRTIAECDQMSNSCLMFGIDINSKYTISYTDRGGILHIHILDDETTGTYICCETYDPNNCVRADIMADYTNEKYNTTDVVRELLQHETENSPGGTITDHETVYSIVIPLCVCVVVIIFGLVKYIQIRKHKAIQRSAMIVDYTSVSQNLGTDS